MISRDELSDVLIRLCPMYILLDTDGRIDRVGPTLQKLRPETPFLGEDFLKVFKLDRPRGVGSVADLLVKTDAKLSLRFRDEPRTVFKGTIVPLPGENGALVNLSFGISVLDAVRDYQLNSADFSATDLAIELLYLVEAKSAAMMATRKLNERLQGAMIAAEERAFTDQLTGLKNRRALRFLLNRLVAIDARFSMMHIDLDFFKQVNDNLGHAAGDHVLKMAADAMRGETRENDMIARVGGDEFVLIFDDLAEPERLKAIADAILKRIEEPMTFEGQTCRVSASIGTAMPLTNSRIDPENMMRQADLALYAAKRAGRGRHMFYSSAMEAKTMM